MAGGTGGVSSVLHPFELTKLSNDMNSMQLLNNVLHPFELTKLSNLKILIT